MTTTGVRGGSRLGEWAGRELTVSRFTMWELLIGALVGAGFIAVTGLPARIAVFVLFVAAIAVAVWDRHWMATAGTVAAMWLTLPVWGPVIPGAYDLPYIVDLDRGDRPSLSSPLDVDQFDDLDGQLDSLGDRLDNSIEGLTSLSSGLAGSQATTNTGTGTEGNDASVLAVPRRQPRTGEGGEAAGG